MQGSSRRRLRSTSPSNATTRGRETSPSDPAPRAAGSCSVRGTTKRGGRRRGDRDLGSPQLVDGGFNGWLIPPSEQPLTVELRWTAQAPVAWGLVIGVFSSAMLVLVLALSRRTPSPMLAAPVLRGSDSGCCTGSAGRSGPDRCLGCLDRPDLGGHRGCSCGTCDVVRSPTATLADRPTAGAHRPRGVDRGGDQRAADRAIATTVSQRRLDARVRPPQWPRSLCRAVAGRRSDVRP